MLKLRLVEDGRVLLEIPLSAESWDKQELRQEFEELETDLEKVVKMFNAFSNASRIRMMRAFFETTDRSMGFTELMNELRINPKLVWDSTRRLRRIGLIEKDDEGRYRPTREGEAQFLMASIALRKLLQILDEI